MVNDTPNLSTDVVQDMLAESPAKEPKAVVADRIPELSEIVSHRLVLTHPGIIAFNVSHVSLT